MMQTDAVLMVSEQSRLEKLIGYTDGFPLLELRKKVLKFRIYVNKGAYLRDPWNILDFVIVMSAYFTIAEDVLELIKSGGQKQEVTAETAGADGLSLNSLRALRVLRPLKAVTSIKDLQILVISIIKSLGPSPMH